MLLFLCPGRSHHEDFSFDDSKMKVLSMMAPRIVDLQNATDIYRIFTFDSDKEKQRISYEIADNPCKTCIIRENYVRREDKNRS